MGSNNRAAAAVELSGGAPDDAVLVPGGCDKLSPNRFILKSERQTHALVIKDGVALVRVT
jgi:hypothetical protein